MKTIYKITNFKNDKVYIGCTSLKVEERWAQHLRDMKRFPHRPLYNAILTIGPEYFHVEVIECVEDENGYTREQYWVQYYNSYHQGYNKTLGGAGRELIDIDHQVVVNYYNSHKSTIETSKFFKISEEIISDILHEAGIDPIEEAKIIQKQQFYKNICMIDLNTKEQLMLFATYGQAADWILKNSPKAHGKLDNVAVNISRCCRNKRLSCYGFG